MCRIFRTDEPRLGLESLQLDRVKINLAIDCHSICCKHSLSAASSSTWPAFAITAKRHHVGHHCFLSASTTCINLGAFPFFIDQVVVLSGARSWDVVNSRNHVSRTPYNHFVATQRISLLDCGAIIKQLLDDADSNEFHPTVRGFWLPSSLGSYRLDQATLDPVRQRRQSAGCTGWHGDLKPATGG